MVEGNLKQQWILEFLLRQPLEDSLIIPFISSFSSTTWNHRITTRLLLRRASFIIQNEQNDDTLKRVLETLQMIANIHQFNGKIMDVMEMANSALRMQANEDAIKLALHRVRLFLTEATDELGHSWLESIVKTMCEDDQDIKVAGTSTDNQAEVGREGSFNGSGDPLDGNNVSKPKGNSVLTPEFRETTEKGKEICQEMAPSTLKPTLDKVNEKSDEAYFPANASIDGQECYVDALGENLEGNDGNFTGDRFRKKDMRSTDNSDLSRKKSNVVETPEFQKVNEAFKSSVLDPKAAVEDTIPDALNLLANVAIERLSSEQPEENQNEEDMDMRDHSVPEECVNIQAKEGDIRCSAAGSRLSLMEWDTTVRTFDGVNAAIERVSSEPPEENQNEEDLDTWEHSVPKECVNIQAKEGDIRCSAAGSRPSLMERSTTARTFDGANVTTERVSSEQPKENQNEEDMDMLDHSVTKECVNTQAKEGDTRCSAAGSQPSLMEPNTTARTSDGVNVAIGRVSSEQPEENQNEGDMDTLDHSVPKECVNIPAKEGDTRCSAAGSQPSLMERSTTARTFDGANVATERVSSEQPEENQNEEDMDTRDHTVPKGCVNIQSKEGDTRCSAAGSQPSLMEPNATARTFDGANVATVRVSSEQPEENQNEEDMDTLDHSVTKECVNIQAKEGDARCSAVGSRPSLMERNTTARTFEWEDEVESSRGSSDHLHLPFLKKWNVTGRRRAKRWSALEEQVLRDAVKEYGRGNWKLILEKYGEIFEERTVVDLKDKWRNMTR